MNAHGAAITICAAAAAGVFLIALAERLRVPSIALLLFGGIALGPEALDWIDPRMLGPGLETVVTLAVAIILFEGGLTLDVAGFRREPAVIIHMLTIGVLVTWAGTAAAIYFAVPNIGVELAVIAGSLVIVTGPTVVSPLLRRIGVQPRLHHILYWEGVLVDAVGVFVAVLCYEWIASASDSPALAPIGRFASRFVIGAGIGLGVGLAVGLVLRRRWLSHEHANIVVLGSALLALALANSVLAESGILAVIVAGLVVSLQRGAELKELKRFKLELTEVGIGLLFVLLAAKLDLRTFVDAGAGLLIVLAVVLFVLRPLNVLLSTWGASFSWRERAFLSWLAPRGIVAASMASLFALRLDHLGYEQASYLETLTYAVIGTTVILQGLSAPMVARLLGLQRRSQTAWLLIGDPWLAVQLHRKLRQGGARTLVFAAGPSDAAALRADDIEAVAADPFDPHSIRDPRIADAEAVLALSNDPEVNDRICAAWSSVVGAAACYRWDEGSGEHQQGRQLWHGAPSPAEIKAAVDAGTCAIDALEIGTPEDARRFGEGLRPLLAIDDGHISIAGDSALPDAQAVVAIRRRVPGLAGLLRDAVIVDKHRTSFEEIVDALLELAANETPALQRDAHLADILDRERTMPTAIGSGVAVPHVYDPGCVRSTCYVALIPGGLDLETPDDAPVRLVFLVVSPSDKASMHLRSLGAIAHLASDSDLLEVLVAQRTRGRLLALIRERE